MWGTEFAEGWVWERAHLETRTPTYNSLVPADYKASLPPGIMLGRIIIKLLRTQTADPPQCKQLSPFAFRYRARYTMSQGTLPRKDGVANLQMVPGDLPDLRLIFR